MLDWAGVEELDSTVQNWIRLLNGCSRPAQAILGLLRLSETEARI
jgi:hypothetical protein